MLRDASGHTDIGKYFPLVTGSPGRQPHIDRGVGPPTLYQQSVVLVQGAGPALQPGVAPAIRYVRADWITGAVSHDSWAAGVTLDSLPSDPVGIRVGLALSSCRVGSRIEVLVPDGRSAAIYVIDIEQAGPR